MMRMINPIRSQLSLLIMMTMTRKNLLLTVMMKIMGMKVAMKNLRRQGSRKTKLKVVKIAQIMTNQMTRNPHPRIKKILMTKTLKDFPKIDSIITNQLKKRRRN